MGVELRGFDDLENDLVNMANALDHGPIVDQALQAGAAPIEAQIKANASSDPKIITGDLYNSIHTGKVKGSKGRKYITTGVHYKERGAYYANPVEYGHGGPAPAPAHPFVRPAFDAKQNDAFESMKAVLRSGLRSR